MVGLQLLYRALFVGKNNRQVTYMETIGAKIDALQRLREKKRALEERITLLNGEISEIEGELITQMDAEGVSASKGNLASASISAQNLTTVEDWDTFYDYIHRNKYYHLLERRPANAACLELRERNGSKGIPGTVPYVKRRLNIRTTK